MKHFSIEHRNSGGLWEPNQGNLCSIFWTLVFIKATSKLAYRLFSFPSAYFRAIILLCLRRLIAHVVNWTVACSIVPRCSYPPKCELDLLRSCFRIPSQPTSTHSNRQVAARLRSRPSFIASLRKLRNPRRIASSLMARWCRQLLPDHFFCLARWTRESLAWLWHLFPLYESPVLIKILLLAAQEACGQGAIPLQAVHPFDYPFGGKVSRVKENSDDRLKRSLPIYESGAFALSSFVDLALRTHGRILDATAHYWWWTLSRRGED